MGTNAVLVRRDAWSLQAPWDPVTLAYAQAVREMRRRPVSDPTSWTYQSGVHGSRDRPPRGAVWNQCQHGGWFFLPWHRMYLYYFERIVRSIVVSQGGPADWALPYWNYEASAGARALPPAFREQNLPDGTANPLFVSQRDRTMNRGGRLNATVASSADAMRTTAFSPGVRVMGFGGAVTNGPQHFDRRAGALELQPHNAVHGQVGGFDPGPNGWMGDPDFAALDPIFWLHHANVDRLWERWLALGGRRANPTDSRWLDQTFELHDESGQSVRLRPSEVLDTVRNLGYRYDTAVPTRPTLGVEELAEPEREPELVAASEHPVDLTGDRASIKVGLDQRTLAAKREERSEPGRAYLNVEDVQGERNPGSVYAVLVHPAGAPPEGGKQVGVVSFFGIEHVDPSREEGGHGLHFTFDVTEAIEQLRDQGAWDEASFEVTFEPLLPEPPEGEAPHPGLSAEEREALPPVSIGRVSLFYE